MNRAGKATALALAGCMMSSYTGITVRANEDSQGGPVGGSKPNIIYILVDDLGYNEVGFNGQTQIKTPNLDRIAQEGMKFIQHYAGCAICAPSRCTLMTGLHTGHTTVIGNDDTPLKPEDTTVAEIIKEAGYTTGIIGKWGLGNYGSTGFPNDKGFDYFYGYDDQTLAHNYYPKNLWRNRTQVTLGGAQYSHDLFTQEALQFIEDNSTEPFFLYLAYTIPHIKLTVPELGEYQSKSWPAAEKTFAAMVTRMDRDIGTLEDKLTELGIDDNTIIMFASDNGAHDKDGHSPTFFQGEYNLRGYKRYLYEGGIRVPFIVKWPGVVRAGAVSDHVSTFWDFLPTVCDIVGVKPPPAIDGISYLPTLLEQGEQKQHDYLYWEFHEAFGPARAVRMGDWKGVRLNADANPNNPIQLYNLKTDISETTNVATSYPGIVAQIEEIIKNMGDSGKHSVARVTTNSTLLSGNPGVTIENVIDGNLSTYWITNNLNKYIQIDLQHEKLVNYIDLAWFRRNERTYNFNIQGSKNGEIFTNILTNEVSTIAPNNEMQRFTFERQRVRYIRIIMNGNSTDNITDICEIAVGLWPAFISVDSIDYLIGTRSIKDTGLEAGNVKASIVLKNNDTAYNSQARVFTALYCNNKLVSLEFPDQISIAASGQKTTEITTNVQVAPGTSIDDYELRVFIWNNFWDMHPVLESYSLKTKDDKVDVEPDSVIQDLVVSPITAAEFWSIQDNLQIGNLQYGDREFKFGSIPAVLIGNQWIQTGNDSKRVEGDNIATFKVSCDADVYIALSNKFTAPPAWMSGWQDTGLTLSDNQATPAVFNLYKKSYTANSTVTLGTNLGAKPSGTWPSMYTVIVVPQN
ncbi:MAG: Arylsulfatase [Firmicutes bacterium ADurb.Bin193]|nr:MAG: Arylsulfatase [Firmicutes bacterium ADurb.Bin193]